MRPRSIPLTVLLLATLLAGCQQEAAARISEIQALQQAGRFADTVEPLRELLQADPDNAQANYLLGIALVQTQRPSQAAWPLRKAAQSEAFTVPASLTLAAVLFGTTNFEAAMTAADRGLAVAPENPALHLIRGRAALASGDAKQAVEEAEIILELEPSGFAAYVLKATALKALERLDDAEAVYRELIELADGQPRADVKARACELLARFFGESDQREVADAQFGECLEAYPNTQFLIASASVHYDATHRRELGDALWRAAVESLPDRYELWRALANRLEQGGDSDAAEKTLVEAVTLFDTAHAWLDLANLRRRRGDPAGAGEAMEKVEERAASLNDEVRFAQADLLIDLGQLERAEEIAAELDQEVYRELLRGRILFEQDRPQDALDVFEKALVSWPNNSRARYLAGRAAEAVGDYPRAIAEYREAFRSDQQATDAALQAARLQIQRGDYVAALQLAVQDSGRRGSSHGDGFLVSARAAQLAGQPGFAREQLKALEEGYPARKAAARAELASLERRLGDPAAARRAIEESGLDLSDPANLLALRSLAELLVEGGEAPRALARVDAALAQHPDAPGLHDLRGRLLLAAGRAAEAQTAFERALELEPAHARALEGLGSVEAAAGDIEAGLALLDRAVSANPDDVEIRYSAARVELAGGRHEAARKRLSELLRVDPTHGRASNDLAWLLAEKSQELGRALELARLGVRFEAGPETFDTLGFVHLQRGEAPQARAFFEKALESAPESPSIRYRLGLALKAEGDSERALEMFRQALGAGTAAFPESEQARQEIAQLEGSRS